MDSEEEKYLNHFDKEEQTKKIINENIIMKIIVLLFIFTILSFSLKNCSKNIKNDYKIDDDLTLDTISLKELNEARKKFKQYIYQDVIDSSKSLPYNLFIPNIYQQNKNYPLVVFIGDARFVGRDMRDSIRYTIGGPIWATESFQSKHKCFVLVPSYNEIIIDDRNGYLKNEFINVTSRLISLIKSKYPIDSKRIYGTGQSMGAMTMLYLLANYPNLFTAGLIVGGQWILSELQGLVNSTFTYIVSSGDEKAFNGQKEVKQYFDYNNIKYGSISSIDAKENINRLEIYVKNIYSLGYKHNFISYFKGSVLSGKTGKENEHISSFKYGYRLDSVKEWLFSQIMKDYSDNYYKSQDGRIIIINYCEKTNNESKCLKCIEGYYLTKDQLSCTKEINCESGDNKRGLCNWCIDNYYLDMNDRKCKSYDNKKEYKFCKIMSRGICLTCDKYHFLDKENKCTISNNCYKSIDTECTKCMEGYYLGLDKKCSNVKNCIYSNNDECIECKDNFYYHRVNKTCIPSNGNFSNCKASNYLLPKRCAVCKDNYYLSQSDYLCHENTEVGPFYKCKISNFKGNACQFCIKDYFLGKSDFKCSKIEGCIWSQNENKCLECDEYYCLDNEGNCVDNYIINDKEKLHYYRCKSLTLKDDKCKECEDGILPNKEGICYDEIHCIKDKKGNCEKCQKENLKGYISYCLNKDLGCIDSFIANCIRCDDIFNLDICTKCEEGYEIDKDGKCSKK